MERENEEPVTQEGLAFVTALALGAGRVILELYQRPSDSWSKEDLSPVTAADHAAHALIAGGLHTKWPTIPVISEEGDIPAYDVRRDWHRFWLVDPLDGTKEYLKRNGEFTVNVALIENGVPVLGVVHAPVLGITYTALRGHGAWRQNGTKRPVRIHSRPALPGASLVIVESRSHPSPALEAWIGSVAVERRVRIGSSLKLCLVADGQAHVYPRFGPTMEWDVAAGDCIYRYAAAPEGAPSPLTYNKPDLRNTDFVLGFPLSNSST